MALAAENCRERDEERRGNALRAKATFDSAPSSSRPDPPPTHTHTRPPAWPHLPPRPTLTEAQAHHQAGALQAGQAEQQEPPEQQRHVPVRDREPASPARPRSRAGSHPHVAWPGNS